MSPVAPTPDDARAKLDQLAADLLRLCNDAWLRRRDEYMGLGQKPRRDSGASAIEQAASEIRSRLAEAGYEERGSHKSYVAWMNAGRPAKWPLEEVSRG